ncbi:NUDIX domain-containing protein [Geobacter sp. AOG2]|uniref:NUDIX hydrolase n=1 Tax=Geobacter sp. AOG2 TaxID=1566347 RepID=UPI001CC5B2BD|nr:NUDIX domain-containing protein [Geobacter sp. AOG2]
MNKIRKAGLAVIIDNKLLIVRCKNTSKYLMPGGKIEKGETQIEALHREIKEELDCEIAPGSLNYIGEFEDLAANNPGKVVNISLYSGTLIGNVKASSEIGDLMWFDPSNHEMDILSDIIKNKILPYLTEHGEIK